MITLSSAQLNLIQSSITTLENIPQELPTRIGSALEQLQPNPSQQTELELSEESVEAVLDSLPMPQPNEDQLITQTRNAFRTFLSTLRNPTPNASQNSPK